MMKLGRGIICVANCKIYWNHSYVFHCFIVSLFHCFIRKIQKYIKFKSILNQDLFEASSRM